LAFLWRSPLHCIEPFKRNFNPNDPYFVVRILSVCFHEETPSVYVHPFIVRFTLCRFFRKSADGSLKMIGAGQNASLAAAVLSLLRSAICSLICSAISNVDKFAYQVVRRSQLCRTANMLSPIIRRLREMEGRKKKQRMVTVDETGLIAVDGFEIERQQWSALIPSILSRCEALLSSLLVTDDWRLVLESTTHVSVGDDFSLFLISCPDRSQHAPSFKLKDPVNFSLLDQLGSYMELSLHGLGLGSLRYAELETMEISRCIWHRGTVYFDVLPKKVFSHKSKLLSRKSIEHKLPHSIARVFLIFRNIVAQVKSFYSSLMAVPSRKESKRSMCHAMAEVFGFSEVPDAVQVRHFWTSILNYTFPDGDLSGALYAEKSVAEMSGHGSRVHKDNYSSHLAGGKEFLYRTFHAAVGERPVGAVNHNLDIRPSDLISSLNLFFGDGASYTSCRQQELVEFVASSKSGHAHADLACGAGKSMAWTLPVAARILSGRRASGKCTIVVSPYKFLSAFQTEAASNFLNNTVDAWIVALNASDFQ